MSSDSFGRAEGLSAPSRRRFVQGLAVGGAVATLGLWPRSSWAVKAEGCNGASGGKALDKVAARRGGQPLGAAEKIG